ncbi:MAG: hypothetical protein Q8O42_19395 [Acidobacteriota bacterium]|nr:hypothetical protein [Acidobacteriota bacterium]
MNKHILRAALLLLVSASPAFAQTGTDLVEVEPLKCWWRTSTSAVRTGEFFDLRLTCAVVETEAARVVPDLSKLDPTVVQLPPFEVTGGTHAGDLVTVGRRFIQYDYRMRLIAEDAFGADVAIPPLEVTYTIESKVTGGESVMGREQSYALPRASVKLISVVPDDTSDIREAPASAFSAIEARNSRANLFQTAATVLFALAGVMLAVILIGMLRSKTKTTTASRAHLAPRAILRHVANELGKVQRAGRGGWTPELAGRALSAARISGSYASGRNVGQRPVLANDPLVDGALLIGRGMGRTPMYVSGSVTAESATEPTLVDALKAMTVSRYGRDGQKVDMDDAISAAIRITKQQQSAHSLISEWSGNFVRSLVDMRKKVWA